VRADPKGRFALVHTSRAPAAESDAPTASAAATGADGDVDIDADNDPAHYLIRANQGHSLAVEETDLLTPLSLTPTPLQQALPTTAVHGTRHAAWPAIVASGGLRVMGRRHVHFAQEVPRELRGAFGLVKEDESAGAGAADAVEDAASSEDLATRDGERKRHGKEQNPAAATVVSGMRNSSSILIWLDLPRALAAGVPFWLSANGVVRGGGGGGGGGRPKATVTISLCRSCSSKRCASAAGASSYVMGSSWRRRRGRRCRATAGQRRKMLTGAVVGVGGAVRWAAVQLVGEAAGRGC